MEIRNLAIIAHVDHGKTTLVDALLKQTGTFRENEEEMGQTTILDSNALEKEKGITILSKNTAIFYKGTKINIIDTPGHADFGGEVERVLNMADGALLIVDAAEGPLPQTKFVLKKALETGLRIIVVINKIDRKDARAREVLRETEDVLLRLATSEDQLHFPVLYAVGKDGKSFLDLPPGPASAGTLEPLLETIMATLPNAVRETEAPFQMLISTLDYDPHLGKIAIGRIRRGKIRTGEVIALVDEGVVKGNFKVNKLHTFEGIRRREVAEAGSGDIIALSGIPELSIGQTITDPQKPEFLPKIAITPPTIKITLGPNTSPLAGREGKYTTSRQIKERLLKERETNLGLEISENNTGNDFTVAGRGELHLAVLIENLRREGFELQVCRPQVILKNDGDNLLEPFEEVTIDSDSAYVGAVTSQMGKRRATLLEMTSLGATTRLVYKISQRNLLGARNILVSQTKGTATISSLFTGYEPLGPVANRLRNGVLTASESGQSLAYGLSNAQNRGSLFIAPGVEVYQGMIVGENREEGDIAVNVCKGKTLTNVRSNKEIGIQLVPPIAFSLEQWLDFIDDTEYLEVTPKSLRGRKKYLTETERRRAERSVL